MDKIKFKTGMIFRSETHPQFDMIIDFVNYQFNDNSKIRKYGTEISWCNINKKAFSDFVDAKLGKYRASKSTSPYAYFGSGQISSIKQRIKKYNLKFIGMSNDVVSIYSDNEYEYCSGFKNMHTELN